MKKTTAAEEAVARELRKAIRKQAKLGQELEATQALVDQLQQESLANLDAIEDFRRSLDGSAFDHDGKLVKA